MSERLTLRVVTPERVVIETAADAVTVPGALGALGILPGHAALLAAMRTGELSWREKGREQAAVIAGGFVEVADNVVTVLADGAELPEEIDLAAARSTAAACEQRLKSAGGEDSDAVRADLALATARIAVASRR